MDYPTTANEWWEMAGSDVIMDVIGRFIDFSSTAPKEIIGPASPDNLIHGVTVREDIERCLQERDVKMYSYCHAAWDMAPDVMGLHEIPGWNLLCDLCSEGPELILPQPPDDKWDEELWDADPNCQHEIEDAPGGGIRCKKCSGWFCY